MKISAIIDQGIMQPEYYKEYFEKIRKTTECEAIIVIADGVFLRDGNVSPFELNCRIEKMKAAGADLIIKVPVFCTLLRKSLYLFSLSNLINKVKCIDTLILPIADDYSEGNEFADSLALELKFSYSTTKAVKLKIDNRVICDKYGSDESFLRSFQEYLQENPDKNELMQFLGGTYSMVDQIEKSRKLILHENSFHRLSQKLATAVLTEEAVRQYMIRCLFNFKKIDNSMCALYEYVPYVNVIWEKDCEIAEWIEKAGFVNVVKTYENKVMGIEKLNESRRLLLAIDKQI